jgi:hypothetical protein
MVLSNFMKGVRMTDPFDVLAFTKQEAREALKDIQANPTGRDSGVCLCGHPRSKHIESHLGYTCSPGKLFCPCKRLRVVVESPNLRPFMFKSTGGGVLHALAKGLAKADELGVETRWTADNVCDSCSKAGKVQPVPVSQRGVEVEEASGFDALLCDGCRFGWEHTDGR